MELGTVSVLVNVVVGVLTVWILVEGITTHRRHRRGHGTKVVVEDAYDAAFLGGGPLRAVDAALATMSADGRIRIAEPGIVTVERAEAHDPVERAVLDAADVVPDGALNTLRHTAARSSVVQRIGSGLADKGLMVPPARDRRVIRGWGGFQAGLFFWGILGSIAVTVVSYLRDWDGVNGPFVLYVGPGLLVGLIVSALVADKASDRLTGNGVRVLDAYRTRHKEPETPAGRVAVLGLGGVQDSTVRTLMVAAAAVGVVALAAGPAVAAGGSGESVGSGESAGESWCGGDAAKSCGGSVDNRGGASCGGDGGGGGDGGCGGGCGGCGGCGG
ncbi:TIGR04222 domain-containing membrane protein [Streptomyces sp. NPDC020875]|uniref:TIGR04222 domain-containing membrane protein n=1 Tax=Streptomyces sp. NPDC020875 TaxID=3154898 RepID=UPI0033F074A1